MINKDELKEYGKKLGIDLIGVANIERFKELPPNMHPSSLLPEAKSVIVAAMRIIRGTLRPIEEGTGWSSYQGFGYGGLCQMMYKPIYDLARYLDDNGYNAVPFSSDAYWWKGREKEPGKPKPEVCFSPRYAAVAAGMGEIGHSRMFLSTAFGPRQRLGMIITDAPLEPDPLFRGKICDDCMECVKKCPIGALSKEKEYFKIEDREFSNGKIDVVKCAFCVWGHSKEYSPFTEAEKKLPEDLKLKPEDIFNNVEDCHAGIRLNKQTGTEHAQHPLYKVLSGRFGSFSVCAGRGCIMACMKHLEKKGLTSFRASE